MYKKSFLSLFTLGFLLIFVTLHASPARAADSASTDCNNNAKTNEWGERSYAGVQGWGSIAVRARVDDGNGNYTLLNGVNFDVYSVSGRNFVLDGNHQSSAFDNSVSATTHGNFFAPQGGSGIGGNGAPAKYCDGYAVFGEGNSDGWGSGAPLWGNGIFFDCTFISSPGDGLDIRGLPATVNGVPGDWVKEYNTQWDNDSDSGNWNNFDHNHAFTVINGRNRFVRLTFIPNPQFRASAFLKNVNSPDYAGGYQPGYDGSQYDQDSSVDPASMKGMSPGMTTYFYFGYSPINAPTTENTKSYLDISNSNLLDTSFDDPMGGIDSSYSSRSQQNGCYQNCPYGGSPGTHFVVHKNNTSSNQDQQWGVKIHVKPDAPIGAVFCMRSWVAWTGGGGSSPDKSGNEHCYKVRAPSYSINNTVLRIDGQDPGAPTGNLPDGTPVYGKARPGSKIQYQTTISLPNDPAQVDAKNAVFESFIPLNTSLDLSSVKMKGWWSGNSDGSTYGPRQNITPVDCASGIGEAVDWESRNIPDGQYQQYFNPNNFTCGIFDNGVAGSQYGPQNFYNNCGACSNAANTPQAIFGRVDDFPRGAVFQISYTLTVNDRDKIGVYPVPNYPNPPANGLHPDPTNSGGATQIKANDFCANPGMNPGSYWTSANAMNDCQSTSSTSFQGVANFFRVGYQWDESGWQGYPDKFQGWYYSEKNYVPIPPTAPKISMSWPDVGPYGPQYQTGNTYHQTLTVAKDQGFQNTHPYHAGPVKYSISDQEEKATPCPTDQPVAVTGVNALCAQDQALPASMDFVYGSCDTNCTGQGFNPNVTVVGPKAGNGPTFDFPNPDGWISTAFDVKMTGAGTVSNLARVLWTDYSDPLHMQWVYISSDEANVVHYTPTHSSFSSTQGNVQASGKQCPLLKNNPPPVAPYIINGGSTPGLTGQYMVSAPNGVFAGGQFNNSGSALTSGNYNSACRSDLVNIVKRGLSNGTLANVAAPSPGFNHVLSPAYSGKVLTSIGDYSLNGTTVQDRMTLYVKGDLYIDGDIDQQTVGSNTAPSFGVIVDGNIYISSNVKHLDGYYFAQAKTNPNSGEIKTCTVPGQSIADRGNSHCFTPLTINGLIMARSFDFERTTKNAPGEVVTYNAQNYVAPPPAFDSLFADNGNLPLYEGELRPQF